MNAVWTDVESSMRERAYEKMDSEPESLLEHDAWFDVDADLYYGRLMGLDGEVVRDVQLPRVEPLILMPIQRSYTMARPVDLFEIEPIRTAQYRLQNGYVQMDVSGQFHPPVKRLRPETQTARLVFLRYRRRL